MFLLKIILFSHRIGDNRKRSYQWTNADQKLLQPVFSNAICHQPGDYWISKTLFLTFFYLRSSIVLTFSIAAYPAWFRCTLHDVTVDISAHNWIKWRYNILLDIENFVSNFFLSTFVNSIDVFDCRLPGVVSLYASWCYGGHFCTQLNKMTI